MDRNELLGNMKKIYGCRQMNAEHCFDGCSVCDFYCTKEKRDETFKAVIAMLEGKDTNIPSNSALDHIHTVVRDDAYRRGYEQGKADAAPKWILVTKDLPKTTDPVEITWVNHDPEVYYSDIKDKPFTGAACYYNGKWWWYSCVCQDFLDEYGKCDMDAMDDAIEVKAWKPFSEPWKGE